MNAKMKKVADMMAQYEPDAVCKEFTVVQMLVMLAAQEELPFDTIECALDYFLSTDFGYQDMILREFYVR